MENIVRSPRLPFWQKPIAMPIWKIHQEHPEYNWKKNKGYPTKEHRAAIREFGITPYHRKSFRLLPEQLSLNF